MHLEFQHTLVIKSLNRKYCFRINTPRHISHRTVNIFNTEIFLYIFVLVLHLFVYWEINKDKMALIAWCYHLSQSGVPVASITGPSDILPHNDLFTTPWIQSKDTDVACTFSWEAFKEHRRSEYLTFLVFQILSTLNKKRRLEILWKKILFTFFVNILSL